MSHDATKVLMGATRTTSKEVTRHAGDPATYLAGLAVRQGASALSLLSSAGRWLGISLGRNLSDVANSVAIARDGLGVPVLLEASPARGTVEVTSYANLVSGTDDSITVGATVFTAQAGAATPGQTTFQAVTDNATTATSLAAQINAHATAGALVRAVAVGAVVTITAKLNTSAGNAIALAYTDNDTNVGATVSGAFLEDGGTATDFVTFGSKVYFSNTTGKADDADSDSTISDAIYVSGVLTGIQEGGTEVAVALVDMPGGL